MMDERVRILMAEDDPGHAELVRMNLERAGLRNPVRLFTNGQQVLDFFFGGAGEPAFDPEGSYLLLLDIRMPMIDGVEVLRRLKADPDLRAVPVIMLTTMDDPVEVRRCHALGCNSYITKPVEYEKLIEVVRQLGLYLALVRVPQLAAVGQGQETAG
jgi:CheY-like chemotaxis protein